MKPIRVLIFYAQSWENQTLSYQVSWPRQLALHTSFECVLVNLLDRRISARFRRYFALRRRGFDVIILLHSVFSNTRYLTGALLEWVSRARQPKVYFIGNEYKLMPEKMELCEEIGVSLLVSQSSSPQVHDLYRQRLGCPVIGIPNTGFDPRLFKPQRSYDERPIDIGYRCMASPRPIGQDERVQIAEYFMAKGDSYGLTTDISVDPGDRFALSDWAAFLNRCKGQLGAEAGSDYFELDDASRNRVNEHLVQNPSATHAEIFELFFKNYRNPVPIRTITGRNVEAAATKTVQILFEGRYDGYLEPDVHYIPLKKDFSNADEAISKFLDETYSQRIAEEAYRLAMREFTYTTLIDKLRMALSAIM